MFDKDKKKTPRKIIDEISELSENSGFNCIGPLTSYYDGENVSAHFSKLNKDDQNFCFNFKKNFSKSLDEITKNNPEVEDGKIRSSLHDVSETAMAIGACRFWKSFGSTVPTECENANQDYINAKNSALEVYKTFNNG